MASTWNLHLHRAPLSFLHPRWGSKSWISAQYVQLRTEFGVNCVNLSPDLSRMARRFRLRAADGLGSVGEEKRSEQDEEVVIDGGEDTVVVVKSVEDAVVVKSVDDTVVVKSVEDVVVVYSKDPVAKFQEMIISSPPIVFMMKRYTGSNLTIMCCIATAFLVMVVRVYVARKERYSRPPGSVADLVRRGQLRSDRRGISSSPLKYEDPFNNPLVKFGKSNSTVEMCGKVYRLAPVTLTKEEQSVHQKRRSRAYQWKRPTIFLKEGDSIPPDVDPDTIRWIPANHPFATTASEIDEDLAQTNVHQKHGVPFRIKAEHEALQRKLEGLQSDKKLNKLVIDPTYAKDFERPFKSCAKSHEQAEQGGINNKGGNSMPSRPDHTPNSS